MPSSSCRCCWFVVVLILSWPHVAWPADVPKVFRAGAATSNITPPIGGLIVGGFHPYPATHIHDELHARCLVLDNGEVRLAIVVCDLLGAAKEMYDEARRLVESETKLPGKHLLMSSTHTHSAATALGSARYKVNQELDDYQRFVARRIADGVKRAINNLAPAKIGSAVGHEPTHVFNRRWFMQPGKIPTNPFGEIDRVKMNPPAGSPDLIEPAGPTDPEVSLLAVQTLEGQPIAVLANYSLHYVGGVPDGHVSADYFAMFCDRMQQLMNADRRDPPFVALMTNGTSGNINNINFRTPGKRLPSYEKMRLVADDVAKAAQAALAQAEYRDWVPLAGDLTELKLATRRPTEPQLDRARKILADKKNDGHRETLEEIYADRTLRLHEGPQEIPIPLQAFRIGDVGISAIPCEVFVEIGLELKERTPFKSAFTISIANGYFGYLPTPEHHRLGGYETWLGTNRLEIEASNKMIAELLRMFESLK